MRFKKDGETAELRKWTLLDGTVRWGPWNTRANLATLERFESEDAAAAALEADGWILDLS